MPKLTKQDVKNKCKLAGFVEPEEFYAAADHELVLDFVTNAPVDATKTVKRLTDTGIPRNAIRIILVIETDESNYSE